MIITNPVNAPAIGTAVWQNASRTLTTLYSTLIFQGGGFLSIAALGFVSIQPPVTDGWIVGVGLIAGAAGIVRVYSTDGTNNAALVAVAAGQTGGIGAVVISNGAYVNVVNSDAANAALYSYTAIRLK